MQTSRRNKTRGQPPAPQEGELIIWFSPGFENLYHEYHSIFGVILLARFRDSLPKSFHEFLKKFPWVNFGLLLAKLLVCARFRLFAHTKRDIAVAGHMSGGFSFGKGGLSFSRGGEMVPSTHKKFPPFVQAQKKLRLGSNRRPMGVFQTHGNLSLGGWQTESRNRSYEGLVLSKKFKQSATKFTVSQTACSYNSW